MSFYNYKTQNFAKFVQDNIQNETIQAPAEKNSMETVSVYINQFFYNIDHRPFKVGFSKMLCWSKFQQVITDCSLRHSQRLFKVMENIAMYPDHKRSTSECNEIKTHSLNFTY